MSKIIETHLYDHNSIINFLAAQWHAINYLPKSYLIPMLMVNETKEEKNNHIFIKTNSWNIIFSLNDEWMNKRLTTVG